MRILDSFLRRSGFNVRAHALNMEMNMRSRFVRLAGATLTTLTVNAHATPLYHVIDLSSQIPFSVTALDMNNSGQLAGTAYGSGGQIIAFRWDPSSGFSMLTNLPSNIRNGNMSAYGINNFGAIAGGGSTEAGRRAVRWSPAGVPEDLGDLGRIGRDNQNQAFAINDAGQVAGSVGGNRAFRFTAGAMEHLPSIGGPSVGATAYGINGSGQVVGGSVTGPLPFHDSELHASRWDGTTPIDLHASLPTSYQTSAAGSLAYKINDAGQTLVWGWTGSKSLDPDGFLVDHGIATPLGFIPLDLNGTGDIVGRRTVGSGSEQHVVGMLWNGSPVDLNTLVAPSDPLAGLYDMRVAFAINDQGEIAGLGCRVRCLDINQERVFLLNPVSVPVPNSVVFAVSALMGIVGVGRFRRSAS